METLDLSVEISPSFPFFMISLALSFKSNSNASLEISTNPFLKETQFSKIPPENTKASILPNST